MTSERSLRVLVVNPGSTSTKIAIFNGEHEEFRRNVSHDAEALAGFGSVSEQLPYRREMISKALTDSDVDLDGIAAVAALTGGLEPMVGGTYPVNPIMLEHARSGTVGNHPAVLGCQLAREIADSLGVEAYVVNPPDVDEFAEVARVTGLAGVTRQSRGHVLNHKEVAHRYAASVGRRYSDLDVVVAHLGGGVSVAAHRRGRMVDCNDVLNGDGPMAPTRAGALPARDVIRTCEAGHAGELSAKLVKCGGFVDHLGTSDTREVRRMIEAGDEYARLVFDAMLYQVGKAIGGCVAVLHGRVDAIVLTGGIVHDEEVVRALTDMVGRFAPVAVYPGELEMAGLAAGVRRVLQGREAPGEYTGVPVWQGFNDPRAVARP